METKEKANMDNVMGDRWTFPPFSPIVFIDVADDTAGRVE
jgi:hypothetical protein